MTTHVEVAVIGGGVVGASVLYHLTKPAGPRVPRITAAPSPKSAQLSDPDAGSFMTA